MNNAYHMATMTRPQPWTLSESTAGRNAPSRYTFSEKLEIAANRFEPISLKEMDGVALLNRIDTKFVLTTGQLLTALARLRSDYRVLRINDLRFNQYRTLYFDTKDFELYRAHVNDRPERYKVRAREYTDSQLSFLEVKHHTRKDRTIKDRIRTAQPVLGLTPDMNKWLRGVSPLDGVALEPKLWNTFTRLTLVSKEHCERITIDTDLTFFMGRNSVHLDGLVIVEVKMNATGDSSPFLDQMHAQRIRQRGFSKYAMGIGMLYDQVKKNSLKPKMLLIEKIMKGSAVYD